MGNGVWGSGYKTGLEEGRRRTLEELGNSGRKKGCLGVLIFLVSVLATSVYAMI